MLVRAFLHRDDVGEALVAHVGAARASGEEEGGCEQTDYNYRRHGGIQDWSHCRASIPLS